MSMAVAVQNGISARKALEVWGETVMRHGPRGALPEALGWPSMSMEARLRKFGHGAKEAGAAPFLTAPEEAIDRLESDRAIADWVQTILNGAAMKHRVYAYLRYARGKCWAEIARQMSEDEPTEIPEIEQMAHAVTTRIRRGMATFRAEQAAE